ncbi:MAG: cytochrome c oxidase accessory protein CcoG [Flavobacteriales bacterium]|nr:cytochrome c oxidase accessory protein CcoG [Flavobacteriales bacterium]
MTDQSEQFRDKLATVNEKGKRIWIYPKKPKGAFFNRRKITSYILLLILFGAPHVKINGLPLVMFNVIERKFIIFGKIFWPQDFFIFAVAMITGIIFITLFTIIFGRLFCGWVCPQTIFMEMVFRRVEYLIEGDYKQQQALNKKPWDAGKIFKKSLKHGIFFGISFLIANTFLAYIIGPEKLWEIQTENPMLHIRGLVSLLIFSLVFYGVFAFLREQVCTTICPYGRLQGVLLDSNSIIVAYDYVRGESRAKFNKKEDRKAVGKGDCIDCGQCVDVCPTGIDIRNGTQLECVNCTACIDACDFMMEKTGQERGLIRLASEEGIKNSTPLTWNKRTGFYTVVLIGLMIFLSILIVTRKDFETTVTRAKGVVQKSVGKNQLINIYDINLVNKTTDAYDITLKLVGEYGKIDLVKNVIHLDEQSETTGKFVVTMDKSKIKHGKNKIEIEVYGNGKLIETKETIFMGPLL